MCRNSSDPACGEFRWDPVPAANQPLVASFATAPGTAIVGNEVVFEVTWSDGDAPLAFDEFKATTGGYVLHLDCFPFPSRFGPWTPPAAEPSSGTLRYPHTFTTAGTYRIHASLATADDCRSPYADFTQVETTIVVSGP